MNRRSFFTKLGLAATSLAVLPAATTYARRWISTPVNPIWIPNSAWETAPYEAYWFHQTSYAYQGKDFIAPILHFRESGIGKGAALPTRRDATNEQKIFEQMTRIIMPSA